MGFRLSSGKEKKSEYFVYKEHAADTINAVHRLGKKIESYFMITEVRAIAADDLWMSPCHNQTSVTIHFTWKQDTDAVMQLLPLIEKELAPFNARPHWGKIFTMAPNALHERYEKLSDFKKFVAGYDP